MLDSSLKNKKAETEEVEISKDNDGAKDLEEQEEINNLEKPKEEQVSLTDFFDEFKI